MSRVRSRIDASSIGSTAFSASDRLPHGSKVHVQSKGSESLIFGLSKINGSDPFDHVGNVVYLVASRYHPRGSTWPSPYSDQLSYVSVTELTDTAHPDWFEVNYTLPAPMRLAGLWLMADGDNTNANFSSAISRLRIYATGSE